MAANLGILGGESRATMEGFTGKAGSNDYGDYLQGLTPGGEGRRMGDAATAASGAVSQEFLENFREFSKAMTPSTDAVKEFTTQFLRAATVLRFTADGDKAAAERALLEMQSKSSNKNQGQAGK
jgi:hypothetical protein